jgi:hypothetical protein
MASVPLVTMLITVARIAVWARCMDRRRHFTRAGNGRQH